MKRQKRKIIGQVITLVIIAFFPVAAMADNFQPSAPPTSGTMHSRDDIYQKRDAIQKAMPTATTTVASNRFVDNNNGTITDTRTNLIWLKNANPCNAAKTWADAVAYCSSLASGQAGLTDGSTAGQWRLPSKEELEGIGTYPPATWESGEPSVTWVMPGTPFTNVQFYYYWSSTTSAGGSSDAWFVAILYGYVNHNDKSIYDGYAWPVRGGK